MSRSPFNCLRSIDRPQLLQNQPTTGSKRVREGARYRDALPSWVGSSDGLAAAAATSGLDAAAPWERRTKNLQGGSTFQPKNVKPRVKKIKMKMFESKFGLRQGQERAFVEAERFGSCWSGSSFIAKAKRGEWPRQTNLCVDKLRGDTKG